MTSVFLLVIAIACIVVATSRQFELNSWAAQYANCSLEVKELTKIAGVCGTCNKQLEELDSCRAYLYDLREEKAKCIVYEEQIKGNTSLALVKNAKFLMKELLDYKNQAAANADKRDSLDKYLRHVEGMMRQLIHNVTVVIIENEKCKMSLNKCIDELEDKTVPSSHKD